ncbi:MAG: SdpA family antimicrobial peptide system protein [Lutibacter sp.]|uniref:SdpA family antimicrobial peptide system protein n=1 Tax=Lutibacter sp. TaxID=1925666 RepID=UPI0017CBB46A|nr:SdpA family antimicrobial peptide system protein [Lutibacter sp.]MBT8317779.1 SdpA family antimicrobial peptide system protein [Lutibacter sp.]NNJ58637.1 SdpA family antimicrobial peptide system protein [Lutibacter sp.]
MKKYLFSFFILIFWSAILINIFMASFPIPSNKSFLNKTIIFSVIPQGWGFFTRNPREELITVYKSHNDSLVKITEQNSSLSSFLGISRKSRLHNIELGTILSKIDENMWVKGKPNELKFDNIKYDTIMSSFYPKNMIGEYFIVKQERIPWAWSKNHKNLVMPYNYARIYVK